jgi:uncharacterized membrane protein
MTNHDAASPGGDVTRPGGPSASAWQHKGLAVLGGSALVLTIASLLASLLGFVQKAACRAGGWNTAFGPFTGHCYTDIYPLYFGEQLATGKVPYFGHHVEYPVLIGGAMQAVAWLVAPVADPGTRGRDFFDLTVLLLTVFLIAGVLGTAQAAGRNRRWTALLVALSPALILAAFINWDLIAFGFTGLGMAAWATRRHALAGLLLGLGIATKFYPVVFFGPLLLLCLRAGRMRAFWTTTAAAAGGWLAVNLPVWIAAPSGWATFYSLSEHRGADWGSIWYFFEYNHWPVLGADAPLNHLSFAAFGVCCAGIALLALAAPRRPRLPQLFFLILATFLMTNKVWSPQYVIWLVPLVVLARPRLWSYALWQLAEIGYFFGIWAYLLTQVGGHGGIGAGLYFSALLGRFCTVGLLVVLVVKDILRPDTDIVRMGGEDDPAGGVLDGAPDRILLRLRLRRVPEVAGSAG